MNVIDCAHQLKTLSVSFDVKDLVSTGNQQTYFRYNISSILPTGTVPSAPPKSDPCTMNFSFDTCRSQWKLVSINEPSTDNPKTTIIMQYASPSSSPKVYKDAYVFEGSLSDHFAVNPNACNIPFPIDVKTKTPLTVYLVLRLKFYNLLSSEIVFAIPDIPSGFILGEITNTTFKVNGHCVSNPNLKIVVVVATL